MYLDKEQQRIQALSAVLPAFAKETDGFTAYRMALCIGNLCIKNDNVYEMVAVLEGKRPNISALESKDNMDDARQQIKDICDWLGM